MKIPVILNLHEWWLLRTTGVGRREQHELLTALQETGQSGGDIDLLAELGGYTLGKRSVKKDLAALFDELMTRIALQLTVSPTAIGRIGKQRSSTYRRGVAAGCRKLSQFKDLAQART